MVFFMLASPEARSVEPVGTRIQGMGGAGVALASDAATVYWNPAGLYFLNRMAADFSVQSEGWDWPQSWGVTYLNYSRSSQSGAGLGVYRIIDNTIPLGGNAFASQLAMVYRSPIGIPIGLSLKYINEKWAQEKRTNYFTADLGFLIPYRTILIGVNFQNIPRSKCNLFPYRLLVGSSWRPGEWLTMAVQIAADNSEQLKYLDQMELRAGLELHFSAPFSLAGGWVKYQEVESWTAGLGIRSSSDRVRIYVAYHWYPNEEKEDRLFLTYNYYL